MTNLSKVISIFLSICFLLFAAKNSFAEYLIQPIPVNSQPFDYAQGKQSTDNRQQLIIINNLTIEQSYNPPPSITFGDLLSSSNNQQSTINNQPETSSNKEATLRELLAQLETSTVESREKLAEFTKRMSTTNYQLPTTNSPTPYIPVPTLIAGVSEIVSSQNSVLGIQSTPSPSPTINYQLTTDIGTLTQNPIRTTYTIAVLGDSMVDTLGKDLPQLRQLLSESFPNYTFALLNYGQGATDLESGLYRLTNTTNYLGQTFTPLLSFKPDILVVESFAYNHWSAQFYDLDRQWLTIAKIIDTVRENSPDTKIVLAASIAPNSDIFGDGSLNWPVNLKWEGAQITRAYLQNMVNFATSQNYPLADAYHPSLGADGKGLTKYINGGDNLHPSGDGGLLFSQKIIEAIKTNNLIK